MAQLAVSLTKVGYQVTGSDKEFYEPMKGLLESHPIKLFHGYAKENISHKPNLVVIGNSISYGNPELEVVENDDIPYSFFPKILNDALIRSTHGISISGTHGKSTTSALCASILQTVDDSSYFIGGIVKGLPESLHIGSGKWSVVEADEYDSAFFAKVPKFHFYRADTLVITSIEFDHADIYNDIEAIIKVFSENAAKVPAEGTVIACIDYPVIRALIPKWKGSLKATVITYGESEEADLKLLKRESSGKTQKISFRDRTKEDELVVPLFGRHNALNALAVYGAARSAGIEVPSIKKGLLSFQGVKRRQDIRAEKNDILLIEDFAHHPTAVRETLYGIREAYPKRRLIAVFEPRSNTSRRKVFENDYISAFKDADEVVLSEVAARDGDQNLELLDVKELSQKIAVLQKAISFPSTGEIFGYLKKNKRSGDVIVVMSNGSFGGLIDQLVNEILENH